MDNNELSTNLASLGTDAISRRSVIDAVRAALLSWSFMPEWRDNKIIEAVEQLPPIQPKLLQPWEVLVAQSVLSQPEIIRCKDCKYARLTNDGSCKYCDIWFPDEAEYMDGDYYCASAERKSNG